MYITTNVEQYNVTLNMTGRMAGCVSTTLLSPRCLPRHYAPLAFGNTTTEAASAPSQSAAMGAESVLAQGVSGQVTGS